MADPKATLIYEWEHDGARHRLVAHGRWSAGYEDRYTVAKLGVDEIGEPRWDVVAAWDKDSAADTLLVQAIKSLLADQRRPSAPGWTNNP